MSGISLAKFPRGVLVIFMAPEMQYSMIQPQEPCTSLRPFSTIS